MKRILISIFLNFSTLGFANSVDPTSAIKAYISELSENGSVLTDHDLLCFADHLEKGELVNPIQMKKSSLHLIHHRNFEDHLEEDIEGISERKEQKQRKKRRILIGSIELLIVSRLVIPTRVP